MWPYIDPGIPPLHYYGGPESSQENDWPLLEDSTSDRCYSGQYTLVESTINLH